MHYITTSNKWETISGLSLKIKDWLNYPCVYVFYLNEELVYIGQTNNFSLRFNWHNIHKEGYFWITRWGKFADFYIKIKYPPKYGKEAMIEKRLISRLRPKFNKRIYNRIKHKTHIF